MRAAITAGRPMRMGDELLVERHLHRAQHALVFAFGIGDAPGAARAAANTGRMNMPVWVTKRVSDWR